MSEDGFEQVATKATNTDARIRLTWAVRERPLRVVEPGALVEGTEREVALESLPPGVRLTDPANLIYPERPSYRGLCGIVSTPEGVIGTPGELVAFGTDGAVQRDPERAVSWRAGVFWKPAPNGSRYGPEIAPKSVNAREVQGVEAWAEVLRWPWADVVAAFGRDEDGAQAVRAAASAAVLATFHGLGLAERAAHCERVAAAGTLPGYGAQAARSPVALDLYRQEVGRYISAAPFATLLEVVKGLAPADAGGGGGDRQPTEPAEAKARPRERSSR